MHLVATAVLTVLAYALLVFVGRSRPRPREGEGRMHLRSVPPLAPAPGRRDHGDGARVLLALLWETGEWAGATFVDESINVGYVDTLGDLAAGGIGSLLAGLVMVRRS
ncbi:hypothetical protein NKG05_25870 [Oerskovia sp. M15]